MAEDLLVMDESEILAIFEGWLACHKMKPAQKECPFGAQPGQKKAYPEKAQAWLSETKTAPV
ncbi:MAG: hypothetical protein EOP85_06430 [Verrucomicrobiaceae bacterium]|nr:MAG: hypothetical protein EOP85_06430 [Verrucomicrobiaceae bacterium]